MTELLPCPFCGGEARVFHYSSAIRDEVWRAVCDKPFCAQGPDGYTEAEAAEAWNTRAAYEMDGWFYLPKPKEGIVVYGEPEITRTENGYKVWHIADFVDEAARKWGEELGEYVMRRICETWNTRADDYSQAAEYWQRMYKETFSEQTCHDTDANPWHFTCSACGYEQNGYELWNYCPNCGAKVVDE